MQRSITCVSSSSLSGSGLGLGWVLALVLVAVAFLPTLAWAEEADDVDIDRRLFFTGDSLSRYDFFGVDGNQGGQVFGQLGNQWYNDLAFTLAQERNPGHKWSFEFAGVENNSLYRSGRWGGEVERMRFLHERGDVGLPYRFEAGDIYGNFSYRTLQRALRGVIVDLQPKSGGTGRQSLQFLYGVAHPDWHEIGTPFDRTAGVSWLWQRGDAVRLSLNYARNFREGDTESGVLDREQQVFSFAGERQTVAGRQPIIFETEIARFQGDHDGLNGPASGQDRQEAAVFAQVSGGGQPFTYRLRHEVAGQDFRPVGGNVVPDRRSWEAYTAWDLGGGRNLNARWQAYRNGYETTNPVDTRTFGLGLRGPIGHGRLWQGGLDSFVETTSDDQGTADIRVHSVVGDLSRTFSPNLSGRLAVSYRMSDDQRNDAGDQRVTQLTVGLDHATRVLGWQGRAGLDLENRLIDAGGVRSREFTPALNVSLVQGKQSLSANYRFQRQDQLDPVRLDIDTAQAGLRYQLCCAADTFGLEYLRNRREDSTGIWTRSYQIAAFWQHAFDEAWNVAAAGGARPLPSGDAAATTTAIASQIPGLVPDPFTGFILGAPFAATVASLATLTGEPTRTWGDLVLADWKLFADIPQRQRMVLLRDGERLGRAVLVIDVDGSVAGQVGDVLDRARRTLIERYGAPSEVDERGTFEPRLAERLRAGLFARTTQWDRPGGVVRLGLPRRLDGRLRVEIHWASTLGRLRDPIWGLDLLE